MHQSIRDYMAAMGRRGGAAGTGAAKARPSDVAKRAALAYWESPEGLARRSAALKKLHKRKGTRHAA